MVDNNISIPSELDTEVEMYMDNLQDYILDKDIDSEQVNKYKTQLANVHAHIKNT